MLKAKNDSRWRSMECGMRLADVGSFHKDSAGLVRENSPMMYW